MFVPVPSFCEPAVLVIAASQTFKLSCEANLIVVLSKSVVPCGVTPNTHKCLSGVDTRTCPTLVGICDASKLKVLET